MKIKNKQQRIDDMLTEFPTIAAIRRSDPEGGFLWVLGAKVSEDASIPMGYVWFDNQGYITFAEHSTKIKGSQYVQWLNLRATFYLAVRFLIERSVGSNEHTQTAPVFGIAVESFSDVDEHTGESGRSNDRVH